MQVRLFFGSNAYAMIRHNGGALDILLEPGRPAPRALREYAADQEKRAADILERAELAKRAADILEQGGN